MQFLVDIPDADVKEGVKKRARTAGELTAETLIRWSLEENFGVPGTGTIKVKKVIRSEPINWFGDYRCV